MEKRKSLCILFAIHPSLPHQPTQHESKGEVFLLFYVRVSIEWKAQNSIKKGEKHQQLTWNVRHGEE